jgi:hypothetical protein
MFRSTPVAIAGALWCATAGCLSVPDRAPAARAAAPTIAGTPAVASVALQEALAEEGISAVEKRQGREVRLVGATASHDAFAVRLTPVGTGKRTRTVVAVQWAVGPDEQVERIIRRVIAASEPAPEESPPEHPGPA